MIKILTFIQKNIIFHHIQPTNEQIFNNLEYTYIKNICVTNI